MIASAGIVERIDSARGAIGGNLEDISSPSSGGAAIASPTDFFPHDVLTRPASSDDAHSRRCAWWLAHTKPRQEKSLAADLLAREVGFYLPLITRKSINRGRTRATRISLFPGYVFVCGNDEDRLLALKTNRVLAAHRVPDGEQLREDLLRFAELISLNAPLLPEARLVEGNRVRVKAGPFRDKEGVVIRRNGKTRLLVAVNYLQQGASLEIDDCLLEPI